MIVALWRKGLTDMTYKNYILRLLEIHRDCNREQYYAEIIKPFLDMCCPGEMKIIPVYDDRKTGKQEASLTTDYAKRMEIVCAKRSKKTGDYVVPDFIFVPSDYTFTNPKKPIIMVEQKTPMLSDDGKGYRALSVEYLNSKQKLIDELSTEIKACGKVICTDGITWMVLEKRKGKIVKYKDFETICLVEMKEEVYINPETNRKWLDYKYYKLDSKRWELTEKIRELVSSMH